MDVILEAAVARIRRAQGARSFPPPRPPAEPNRARDEQQHRAGPAVDQQNFSHIAQTPLSSGTFIKSSADSRGLILGPTPLSKLQIGGALLC